VSAITGADLQALGAVTATDITKSMPAVVLTQPNGPSSFTLSIRASRRRLCRPSGKPGGDLCGRRLCQPNGRTGVLAVRYRPGGGAARPARHAVRRNATSGLAQFVSRRPTDEYEGYADVTTGEHNLFRVEGAVSGPLWEGWMARGLREQPLRPLFTHFGIAGGQDSENGDGWPCADNCCSSSPTSPSCCSSRTFPRKTSKRRLGSSIDHQSGAGSRRLFGAGPGQRLWPRQPWALHQRHEHHACTGYPSSGAFSTYGNSRASPRSRPAA